MHSCPFNFCGREAPPTPSPICAAAAPTSGFCTAQVGVGTVQQATKAAMRSGQCVPTLMHHTPTDGRTDRRLLLAPADSANLCNAVRHINRALCLFHPSRIVMAGMRRWTFDIDNEDDDDDSHRWIDSGRRRRRLCLFPADVRARAKRKRNRNQLQRQPNEYWGVELVSQEAWPLGSRSLSSSLKMDHHER